MREMLDVECAFLVSHSLIPRSNYSLSILSSCSILSRPLVSNSDFSVLYEWSKGLKIVTSQRRLDLLTSLSSIEASGTVSKGCNVSKFGIIGFLERTRTSCMCVQYFFVSFFTFFDLQYSCFLSYLSTLFSFSFCFFLYLLCWFQKCVVEHVPGR